MVIAASPAIAVIRPMANLLEIILALVAAERWCNRAVPLSAPQNLAIMLLVAGALAPIAAATLGAGAVALIDGAPFLPLQRDWFAADAFGTIIAGPLFLVGSVTRGRDLIWSRRCYEIVPIAAVVAGVTFLIFEIARIPALFLILPALTLATFRLRLLGAAMGIVIVAAIATMETLRGLAPYVSYSTSIQPTPGLTFTGTPFTQLASASAMCPPDRPANRRWTQGSKRSLSQ